MRKLFFSVLIILFIFSCSQDFVEVNNPIVLKDKISQNNQNLRLQNNASPLPSPPVFQSPNNISLDASGRVSIKVFSKELIGIDNTLEIEVSQDYVVIDGGAFIDENYNDAKIAFIFESYPMLDVNKWRVRTKTYFTSKVHKVVGYAIGLKIKGIASSDLKKSMLLFHNTKHFVDTKEKHYTSCHIPYPYNDKYAIAGGGAVSTNPLLISSKITINNAWHAEAMNSPENASGTGLISSFAIGISKDFLSKNKLNLYYHEPYRLQVSKGAGYNYFSISNSDISILKGRLLLSFGTSENFEKRNEIGRRGLVAMCREKNNLNKAFKYSKPYPDGAFFETQNFSNSIFIYGR